MRRIEGMRLPLVALCGLAAVLLTVAFSHAPGLAFTSCSSQSGLTGVIYQPLGFSQKCITGHWEITVTGANTLSCNGSGIPGDCFSWPALTRVADADIRVDSHETSFSPFPPKHLVPAAGYDPTHHFDHPVGESDEQAFINARYYVSQEKAIIIQDLHTGACNVGEGLDALGRALHAIQDVYSHSNYVDLAYKQTVPEGLTPAEKNTLDAAVLDVSVQPPATFWKDFRLTLYDRAADPENPTGYCNGQYSAVYCHEFWSKDSPAWDPISGLGTGDYSVYFAAYQAAKNETARFIQGVIQAVGQSTWNNLVGNYGTANAVCNNKPQPPCSQMFAACNPPTLPGQSITSGDPNDKAGSQGVGTQQYISGSTPLRYAVQFGNEPTASAPAQKVVVTDPLDITNDNLQTLNLGPISFLNQVITPPPGPGDFSTTMDLRPGTDLLVAINTHLDQKSGTVTWTFQSIDPATGKPPADPSVGFLPPGANGSVFFTVQPKQGLSTDTQIQNQATVVFDVNLPISTPTWLNTLDNDAPISQVAALPSAQPYSCFPVHWSGTDVGSGVQNYSLFVSDNGAPYTAWQTNTTATSAVYNGQAGHTYAFYSQAQDRVGNVEPAKTLADVTTSVNSTAACNGVPALSGAITDKSVSGATITISLQLMNNGQGNAQDITINQITFRTLSGTGSVMLASPPVPISLGTLAAGASTVSTFTANLPSTIIKFSLIESGTVRDSKGTTYNFSIGQVVYLQ